MSTEFNANPQREQRIRCTLTIASDPAVRHVAVSWAASEGLAPQALTFGPEGGNASCVVSTAKPEDLRMTCITKISWRPPHWPITHLRHDQGLLAGGANLVIQPGSLIRRHTLFVGRRHGGGIVPVDFAGDEWLVAKLSYSDSQSNHSITDTVALSAESPMVWSYPTSGADALGKACVSLYGVVAGETVRTEPQPLAGDAAVVWVVFDCRVPAGVDVVQRG